MVLNDKQETVVSDLGKPHNLVVFGVWGHADLGVNSASVLTGCGQVA